MNFAKNQIILIGCIHEPVISCPTYEIAERLRDEWNIEVASELASGVFENTMGVMWKVDRGNYSDFDIRNAKWIIDDTPWLADALKECEHEMCVRKEDA